MQHPENDLLENRMDWNWILTHVLGGAVADYRYKDRRDRSVQRAVEQSQYEYTDGV